VSFLSPDEHIRFSAKYTVDPASGCWLWTGYITAAGYGTFPLRRKSARAHRVAVLQSGREIPAGMEVDHLCRVRHCVNPGHLAVVTHATNIESRVAPSNTKLSAEKVREIHRLCAAGTPKTQIAERFGVSDRAVRMALKGITWKSVNATPEGGQNE
jgi:hypothetical protein